jgi:predicted enzyme related to lactoylglutathione lyase
MGLIALTLSAFLVCGVMAQTCEHCQHGAKPPALHSICHVEIPTTDFTKSKAFYEALFGWKVEIDTVMNYASFETGTPPGGGFMKWDKISQEKETTNVYVLVASIEESCQKAQTLGGIVACAKTPVGDMGWFAMVVDPCGAGIGLWEEAKKQ